MRIGVISDTHGLLRPEAIEALTGVEHILHAGDVGGIEILDRLRAIAPVTAIRGNVDGFGPCSELPEIEVVEMGGFSFYMLHDLQTLDLDPIAAGMAGVIYGHSHQPKIEEHNGVLYFNPGSAGPKRFSLPVSLGFLEIADGKATATLNELL